jgi:hypothetical protein
VRASYLDTSEYSTATRAAKKISPNNVPVSSGAA